MCHYEGKYLLIFISMDFQKKRVRKVRYKDNNCTHAYSFKLDNFK